MIDPCCDSPDMREITTHDGVGDQFCRISYVVCNSCLAEAHGSRMVIPVETRTPNWLLPEEG